MANTIAGLANLASGTGETMRIDFLADYSGATPGSSAWDVAAKNVRITVNLPEGRDPPGWFLGRILGRPRNGGGNFIDQCVLLGDGNGRIFSGEAPLPLLIRSGEMGQSTSYDQVLEFTPGRGEFGVEKIAAMMDNPAARLGDPVSRTSRFRVNLFLATRFATTDQGEWDNI